jgi:hypothetical protein
VFSLVVVQTGHVNGEQISRFIFFFFDTLIQTCCITMAEEGCSPTKRILSQDMRSGGRMGQTSALP